MSGSASPGGQVIVVGASFAGLLAAAAAAQAGARVTVFERDRLSDTPDPRPGVPQGLQPHVLLHRGLRALESLLPGVERDLLAAGGVKIDTGRMPWLSAFGWFPADAPSYEIVSMSRPLLELVIRRRVLADERIDLRDGARVRSLGRAGPRWEIRCADGSEAFGDLVVDASGRSSRLRHWLDELGVAVPEPATVEASLGYAARRYRAPAPVPLRSGVVIAASQDTEAGAIALPVENDEWLVCAAGYGTKRPSRDVAEFDPFLQGLRDPVIAELSRGPPASRRRGRLPPDGEPTARLRQDSQLAGRSAGGRRCAVRLQPGLRPRHHGRGQPGRVAAHSVAGAPVSRPAADRSRHPTHSAPTPRPHRSAVGRRDRGGRPV